MFKRITFSEFVDTFRDYGREDQFSYEGLKALYEFIVDNYEDYELDVIDLCVNFTEYKNIEELQEDYNDIEDIQDLEYYTTVIMIDDESFIIQNF
jgi:hypothetical protein